MSLHHRSGNIAIIHRESLDGMPLSRITREFLVGVAIESDLHRLSLAHRRLMGKAQDTDHLIGGLRQRSAAECGV